MSEIATIGLDIGKRVLQVHGADATGNAIIQRKLRREEVLPFFAKLPPVLVGMEACGTSHYWGRELRAIGHDVRLIPPSYVKPYVVRQKNDAADAAGICEAVTRPSVRTTPIKSIEQQAARVLHRAHELLSRQRVTLINAIRGHMAEFGVLVPAGTQNLGRLMERISNPETALPSSVRKILNMLADQLVALSGQIDAMEAQMRKQCREIAMPLGLSPSRAWASSRPVPFWRACPISMCSNLVEVLPPGWALCPVKTPVGARIVWDGSPKWAIPAFANSWSSERYPRSAGQRRRRGTPNPGSPGCLRVSRSNWRPLRWRTRWHVSSGRC